MDGHYGIRPTSGQLWINGGVGHSLRGMDVHYLAPSEDSLKGAMEKYTRWLDEQIDNISGAFDQNLAQSQ